MTDVVKLKKKLWYKIGNDTSVLLIFHLVCRRMSISLDNEQHMCLFCAYF